MSDASKPPLVQYRPNQRIVRAHSRPSRLASQLAREPEASRQGAILGFSASMMAAMILILMMVEWPQAFLNFYGFGAMLCLPFCGIAGGSCIGRFFDPWHRRSLRGVMRFAAATAILGAVGFLLPMAIGVNVFAFPAACTLIALAVLVTAAILSQK